ncbi:unnamed protein product [Effrenium voratum]|nr:unnamed protein product [Effrenium voratum]
MPPGSISVEPWAHKPNLAQRNEAEPGAPDFQARRLAALKAKAAEVLEKKLQEKRREVLAALEKKAEQAMQAAVRTSAEEASRPGRGSSSAEARGSEAARSRASVGAAPSEPRRFTAEGARPKAQPESRDGQDVSRAAVEKRSRQEEERKREFEQQQSEVRQRIAERAKAIREEAQRGPEEKVAVPKSLEVPQVSVPQVPSEPPKELRPGVSAKRMRTRKRSRRRACSREAPVDIEQDRRRHSQGVADLEVHFEVPEESVQPEVTHRSNSRESRRGNLSQGRPKKA